MASTLRVHVNPPQAILSLQNETNATTNRKNINYKLVGSPTAQLCKNSNDKDRRIARM